MFRQGASAAALAQQGPLQPGEAVVTRFSGTTSVEISGGVATVINPEGTSASIIDLRSPGRPPQGDHWINEPQRRPVTANQVGQVFGVTLDNESGPNSGAALGNIAYDRWNQQLFVSDLETGLIHRIRASDGADLGFYDHGVSGRADFLDAESKQPRQLRPIAFDPASRSEERRVG